MSQENVELVRSAYEEDYARRRIVDDLRDRFADDFRFHTRPEFPGRLVYHLDEIPALWADLDETYTEYSLVPADFTEVNEYVVVTLEASARMKDGEARIEATLYHVWHLQDGKLREAWTYGTRGEALEAVGLE